MTIQITGCLNCYRAMYANSYRCEYCGAQSLRAITKMQREEHRAAKRAEYIKRISMQYDAVGGFRFGYDMIKETHLSIMDKRK